MVVPPSMAYQRTIISLFWALSLRTIRTGTKAEDIGLGRSRRTERILIGFALLALGLALLGHLLPPRRIALRRDYLSRQPCT